MEFSRQEYWNGLPFLPSRKLPQGLNSHLLCFLLGRWIFTTESPGKPLVWGVGGHIIIICTNLNKPIEFLKNTIISSHFTEVEHLLTHNITVKCYCMFVWLLLYSVLLAYFFFLFLFYFYTNASLSYLPILYKRTFLVAQMVKASACNAGDPGLIPGSGRSPGEGNGNPFQHSCLENPMDRGAW